MVSVLMRKIHSYDLHVLQKPIHDPSFGSKFSHKSWQTPAAMAEYIFYFNPRSSELENIRLHGSNSFK